MSGRVEGRLVVYPGLLIRRQQDSPVAPKPSFLLAPSPPELILFTHPHSRVETTVGEITTEGLSSWWSEEQSERCKQSRGSPGSTLERRAYRRRCSSSCQTGREIVRARHDARCMWDRGASVEHRRLHKGHRGSGGRHREDEGGGRTAAAAIARGCCLSSSSYTSMLLSRSGTFLFGFGQSSEAVYSNRNTHVSEGCSFFLEGLFFG